MYIFYIAFYFSPLKAELNPICHLLALLGAHHILHVSRIRVNFSTKNIPYKSARTNVLPDDEHKMFETMYKTPRTELKH